MKRLATPLLALAIFLLNVWLNAPLFMHGELPFRGSIEPGYVAMSRFISQHPNMWGWNPFPYCGLPTQFMYVPGVPYLTAVFLWLLPHGSPDDIYRTLVSLFTCFGPVTVFFFALYFTGSRKWAFLVAVAYGFISPSYALFPDVEKDRGIVQLPWRIQVLAKYGEGPHNTGLMLMPLTLLACWLAATRRGYKRLFLAAVLLAVVPLTNWVAGLALGIACTILLIAALGEKEFNFVRASAAVMLAYLLACFWLTPSFIRTIAFNWPVDSFAYHLRHVQQVLLVGLIAGVILIRLLFWWLRGSFYFCLVTLGAFVFGWIATSFYIYGVDTIPESRRYAIEFELFTALAVSEALRLTLRNPNQTVRMCAIGTAGVILLVGSPQIYSYVTQGWSHWTPAPPQNTVEYRLSEWIAQHPPEGRVFASGGMRFRMNSWFDFPQAGGGFETGLQNRMPVDLAYGVRAGADLRPGHELEDTLLELKTLGVQYVVVHGPKSREYYRDYVHPERLAGALPVVHREEDDVIYALPPRPLAHLVSESELPPPEAQKRPWTLQPYVAAMEDPARPALRTRWLNSGRLTVDGSVPPGRSIAVQVNADRGWRATQDGREVALTTDNLGFIVVHAQPSAGSHIELEYRGTAEQRIMAILCVLTWIGALGALIFWRSRWQKPSALTTTN